MTDAGSDSAAEAVVASLLADAIATLDARGVHDEALGVYKRPRSILGIQPAPSIRSAGRAWRLGALLLARDGRAFEVGQITRAIEPGRAAVNRTALGEQRRADRMAASRGPFVRGEVVNFDYSPIDLSAAALRGGEGVISIALVDGTETAMVRWDVGTGIPSVAPLERYLADRLTLILDE